MTEDVGGLDQDRMVVLSLKPRFAEAILVSRAWKWVQH